MSEVQYSYETVGSTSYLVATFPQGRGVVNYQLQMMVNNDIKNIIKASKKQKNDDVLISYNVTSRIPLSEIDNKGKITKSGLINIIEGAIAALNDIAEYQLVNSGIVFEEEYIFVKPDSYEPSFIYLPCTVENGGIEPLKKFLLSLIMNSKVEMTNDNFVQVLLETLNNPSLDLNELKKLCVKSKSGNVQKSESAPKLKNTAYTPEVNRTVSTPETKSVPQAEIKRDTAVIVGEKKPEIKEEKKHDEKAKKENAKTEKKSEPKKIVFLIMQIVLLAAVAAIVLSGVLSDAEGNINLQYLLGIVLGVGCVDFVVYREMFSNQNKEKDTKKEKKQSAKAPKNVVKKPEVAMPGRDVPNKPTVSVPGKEEVKKSEPVEEKVKTIAPQMTTYAIPQPTYVEPQKVQYGAISDFETEDTVVLDNNDPNEAYLEFFENGLSRRIKLNKERIVVGKLKSQCDFVINNNKISKMHAEFISRNGEYFVKDYNSTNGTYINGSNQRIQSNVEFPIFCGDRVTLANIDLTFKC